MRREEEAAQRALAELARERRRARHRLDDGGDGRRAEQQPARAVRVHTERDARLGGDELRREHLLRLERVALQRREPLHLGTASK